MVTEDPGNREVREKIVNESDVFVRIPFGFRHVDEFTERLTPEREALMRSPGIEHKQIADRELAYRFTVQRIVVVGL